MRATHKIGLLIGLIVMLLLALLVPRTGHADQTASFGDVVVRYSAISTDQLFPAVAQNYGIERSSRNGLVNIAIEKKGSDGASTMIAATVAGKVADLTGHSRTIRFRETNEAGAIDYLGEFPIDASGTYVFTINVSTRGQATPYTVKFNRDYVAD
ncbi:MAG TPA: DUF4426 domain-containing protein [Rudaea sp.]|nr:DUF4426 domain-containing protein [Rudaea sp.]